MKSLLRHHNITGLILVVLLCSAQMEAWGRGLYLAHVADPVWVRATVQLVPQAPGTPPKVAYWSTADRPIEAVWTAIVSNEAHERLQTRRGHGNYKPRPLQPPFWTWDAFFDDGVRNPPKVPAEPFMLCVWYRAKDDRTGIVRDTPEFCSDVFDPVSNTILKEEPK